MRKIGRENTFLITGSAGFVGFHIAKELLKDGHIVHGIDLMNASYYDPLLKHARLSVLSQFPSYSHYTVDLAEPEDLEPIKNKILDVDVVVHLAAQACVLRSFEFPHEYVKDNMVAFQNMLELFRESRADKFLYASSSSVYG